MDNKKSTDVLADMKQIPNFPQYYATKEGKIWSIYTNKFLSSSIRHRYFVVCLSPNRKWKNIHRLILETFIGPCPDGMEACHNNGIRTDNRLENLRWDTRKNNQHDRRKHGTNIGPRGEKSGNAKLTEQDIRMIIYMYRTGEFTQKEIANIYSISRTNISLITTKRNWKHLWAGDKNGR